MVVVVVGAVRALQDGDVAASYVLVSAGIGSAQDWVEVVVVVAFMALALTEIAIVSMAKIILMFFISTSLLKLHNFFFLLSLQYK